MKFLKNNKGATLVELIVSMLIFSVIATSVAALLISFTGTYGQISNLAEMNATLDNLSAELLSDLHDTTEVTISETAITIQTNTNTVVYTIGTGSNAGLLCKDGRPVLNRRYYKGKTAKLEYYDEGGAELSGTDAQIFIVRIQLMSAGKAVASRDYAVRPLGLIRSY